jgi:hypothetical protein
MKRLLAGIAAVAAIAVAPSVANAQDDTQITLLHGIPGATVDVSVDGQVLLPGFEPGATQDLTPFAGQTLANVEVFAAGTQDVVIGPIAELPVPDSGNWTVLAHLDAEGTPTITPFENDTTATNDGEGRLTVRHAAAAPAVDLVVGDARPVTDAANGDEAPLALPAGEIAGAQIAPAGGDPIADVPTVDLAAGTNLIVYAVGSLDDDSFTFYTQEIEVGTEAAAGGTDDSAAEGDAGADDSTGEGDAGADDSAAEGDADDSAAEGGADDDSDGTPAPTAVNTGSPLGSSTNIALLSGALGLLVLSGGALALRHRSVDR